nr:hypothetical protein [Tanacetum cinerariifolium]
MGDEHLDTIPATESNEFIKSCIENLVPNPSESEGENKCDVPAGFTTFSNVLFDADYDFDSGDDQSTSDEIDSLFDEFAGEITLLKSILPGIDETDCHPEEEIRLIKRLLYDNSSARPSEEIVFDNSNADIESFSPSPILIEDISVGCQKPGHLAARLGCAETKVATWDDLAFKLITLGKNVKH